MVDKVAVGEDTLMVTARSRAMEASCPLCDAASRCVQNHYIRHPPDWPGSGRRVRLHLLMRRCWCDVPSCQRQVVAERFNAMVIAERARRSGRLEDIAHHLGLAMGGVAEDSDDVVAGMAAESASPVPGSPNG